MVDLVADKYKPKETVLPLDNLLPKHRRNLNTTRSKLPEKKLLLPDQSVKVITIARAK